MEVTNGPLESATSGTVGCGRYRMNLPGPSMSKATTAQLAAAEVRL
jgi:hypothetical protein